MKFQVNPFFWQRQALKKHPTIKRCEYKSCAEEGTYRAPRHDRPHDIKNDSNWHWLCLDHVRDYNAAWDFYKDMSEEEILASRRRGIAWDRPSWPVGDWQTRATTKPFLRSDHFINAKRDPFGLFDEEKMNAYENGFSCAFTTPEIEAIALFGLTLAFTQEELQKAYRALVKRHHPDVNGGSVEAEDRIKSINVSYELLKIR
ncbi:MAG: DnaJ domain-containing protein [Pseudomonadota bacterium]